MKRTLGRRRRPHTRILIYPRARVRLLITALATSQEAFNETKFECESENCKII